MRIKKAFDNIIIICYTNYNIQIRMMSNIEFVRDMCQHISFYIIENISDIPII